MSTRRGPLGKGRLKSGLAGLGSIRWAVVDLTEIVEALRLRRDLSPLASVAQGQLLAGAALMWRLQLKTPMRLILRLNGDGALGRVTAEATEGGSLRGTVQVPQAALPEDAPRPLDVGAAIGSGLLSVIRQGAVASSVGEASEEEAARVQNETTLSDRGLYESKVPILEGKGISHQLSFYLEQSEQTQSALLLGVLVRPEGVAAAGGLMMEALPGTDEDLVAALESRLAAMRGVSRLLADKGTDALLDAVLGEMDREPLEEKELLYQCGCERERFRRHLSSLSASDREYLLAPREGEPEGITVECDYCGEAYSFEAAEISAVDGSVAELSAEGRPS